MARELSEIAKERWVTKVIARLYRDREIQDHHLVVLRRVSSELEWEADIGLRAIDPTRVYVDSGYVERVREVRRQPVLRAIALHQGKEAENLVRHALSAAGNDLASWPPDRQRKLVAVICKIWRQAEPDQYAIAFDGERVKMPSHQALAMMPIDPALDAEIRNMFELYATKADPIVSRRLSDLCKRYTAQKSKALFDELKVGRAVAFGTIAGRERRLSVDEIRRFDFFFCAAETLKKEVITRLQIEIENRRRRDSDYLTLPLEGSKPEGREWIALVALIARDREIAMIGRAPDVITPSKLSTALKRAGMEAPHYSTLQRAFRVVESRPDLRWAEPDELVAMGLSADDIKKAREILRKLAL